MALPETKPLPALHGEERRRFQRVKVNILGRYMLADRREFPCQVTDMSPGSLALLGQGIGGIGERVIVYLDHLGRVEGKIARILDNGFAMTVNATPRKRDRLAAQLTWLANRDILSLPEDRRHERYAPRNPITRLVLADGVAVPCRIIDVSLSGASLASEVKPAIGSHVTLGKVPARVIRHTEEGFAVEFALVLSPAALEDSVSFP